MSRRKTECKKVRLFNQKHASQIAEEKSKEWGLPTRVYPCLICHALHITTKLGSEIKIKNRPGRPTSVRNKNVPETMKMQRLRYKRRQELPIAVWENEGGSL